MSLLAAACSLSPLMASTAPTAGLLLGLPPRTLPAPEVVKGDGPPPNVLLIAVDDLNDYVASFGGHPQALTPHLDAFHQSGAVAFQRAYCAGPVCGPSRSSLLSGFMPQRTGVYANPQNLRWSPLFQTHTTLPEYFAKHGYYTLGGGKIFHRQPGSQNNTADYGHWAFEEYRVATGSENPDSAQQTSRNLGVIDGVRDPDRRYTGGTSNDFAWGPTSGPESTMPDTGTANWAAERLGELPTDQPFFMAVGFAKPHLPWYVPEKYFDLYPPESVQVPEVLSTDLDDIRRPNNSVAETPSDDYLWVIRYPDLHRSAVRAYLAATSYADACVGIVLDALANSPHADNTIVVIFGDHGWHLGEKLRFRKFTLWEEATRLPLMVRVPGMQGAKDCHEALNLIDLYPTLIDLCGLPPKDANALDGRSFVEQVWNPAAVRAAPTVVIESARNGAAVIDERFYYVKQSDGTEELYDMQTDPLQWTNLIKSTDPTVVEVREYLKTFYPPSFAPTLTGSNGSSGTTPDPTLKATRVLSELN